MARLLGLLGVVLLLTACTPGMQRFTLPENVAPPAPAAQQGPPALAALAGPWTGTWFTPDWGLGYDALLLVESIDADQATVLYAWTNPGRGGDGWYRQKARLLPGPGLEWTRGTWTFRLHLDPDGARLAGTTERATPPDKAFITMERTPFAAPPPKQPPASAALPRLPAEARIWAPAELPRAAARWVGIWEGTWDSGIPCRLVVQGIADGKAKIVYEWRADPQAGTVDGLRRLADVNVPAGILTWGQAPTLTFRVSADGRTLRGEWERDGDVSAATLRKVVPE
jgi:hypothetical protein